MGIRSTINEKRGLAGILTAGAIVLAVVFLSWQRTAGPSGTRSESFYSDDDGASYFVAPSTRIIPFDHHGKPAVLAAVYRCGADGKPFVGYLMKYEGEETPPIPDPPAFVKKPGDTEWIEVTPKTHEQRKTITSPVCQSGESGEITQLTPSDPKNRAQRE